MTDGAEQAWVTTDYIVPPNLRLDLQTDVAFNEGQSPPGVYGGSRLQNGLINKRRDDPSWTGQHSIDSTKRSTYPISSKDSWQAWSVERGSPGDFRARAICTSIVARRS